MSAPRDAREAQVRWVVDILRTYQVSEDRAEQIAECLLDEGLAPSRGALVALPAEQEGQGHDFRPVAGHPDDDECTHRADGTDATYCGRTQGEHESDHHPNCYQRSGVPEDLPGDLCDCRVLRAVEALAAAFSGDEFEENAAAAAGAGEWSWFRWLAVSTVDNLAAAPAEQKGVPCKRCQAESGSPCRRPNGDRYINVDGTPRLHAGRASK